MPEALAASWHSARSALYAAFARHLDAPLSSLIESASGLMLRMQHNPKLSGANASQDRAATDAH
jgi:hypothetical protein